MLDEEFRKVLLHESEKMGLKPTLLRIHNEERQALFSPERVKGGTSLTKLPPRRLSMMKKADSNTVTREWDTMNPKTIRRKVEVTWKGVTAFFETGG